MSPDTRTSPIDEYGRYPVYPGISPPALPSSGETEHSEGRVQILVEFFNRIYRDRRKGNGVGWFSRNEVNKSFGSDYDVKRTKPGVASLVNSPMQRDDSITAQGFSEHGKVTLSDLGASTLLPPAMYLLWRVFVLMFSCMVMTWILLLGPSLETTTSLTSSILSFFIASKMVLWTLLFRRWRVNHEKLTEQRRQYRWDALIFQTNFHLSFMSIVALLLCSFFGTEHEENQSAFLQNNLGLYLLLVNTVVLFIDVLLTPISFDFVSVVIAAVIVTVLTFITFRPNTTIERQTGVWAVGATSLVVGSALHIMCLTRVVHCKIGKGVGNTGGEDSRDADTQTVSGVV